MGILIDKSYIFHLAVGMIRGNRTKIDPTNTYLWDVSHRSSRDHNNNGKGGWFRGHAGQTYMWEDIS
jgi:hypothetical protein